MTIVTIPERSMMNEGVKNRGVRFDFGWPRALRLKNTVGPAPALHKQLQYSIKRNLRVLVDFAWGLLQRGARLEAIGPIG